MTQTIYDAIPTSIDPDGDLTPEWLKKHREELANRVPEVRENYIQYGPDQFKTHKLDECEDDEL